MSALLFLLVFVFGLMLVSVVCVGDCVSVTAGLVVV